jgi:phosphonate transport system substrate-binding protein
MFVAGCGAATGTGGGGVPTKSEYVVAPLQGAFGELAADLNRGKPLGDFLAQQTGLAVKVYPPGDYTRSVTGLHDGSLDFVFVPALLYLRAHDDSGAEPLFRTLRPGADGKPVPAFTSIIAVRTDSGINGVGDLKGKRVAATDATDAAGWVLPAAQLKKAGLDPARDVTVEYRKDGPDALVQVLNKKSDAAFAAKHDLADPAVTKVDANAAQTLKLLTTIEGAPLEVIVARKGLDARVLGKFKAAFQALGDPQKATFTANGKTQPILAQWGVSGLAETKDGDYAALRDAAKAIGVKLK